MDSTAALKKTKKQLHESGFKLTPQREATVLVLLENEKDHLSAEEIYFLVKQKKSGNWSSNSLSNARNFNRLKSR